MLVLSRKPRESVVVGGDDGVHPLLKVTVLEIAGGKVKLGFEGDMRVPVHRMEVWERIRGNGNEHALPVAEGLATQQGGLSGPQEAAG
jgi:carbon storage regulator CsrA